MWVGPVANPPVKFGAITVKLSGACVALVLTEQGMRPRSCDKIFSHYLAASVVTSRAYKQIRAYCTGIQRLFRTIKLAKRSRERSQNSRKSCRSPMNRYTCHNLRRKCLFLSLPAYSTRRFQGSPTCRPRGEGTRSAP